MKMTLAQAFDMIERGESPEQYEWRTKRLRRLTEERYWLEDSIEVLADATEPQHIEKLNKKRKRLTKVLAEIETLK